MSLPLFEQAKTANSCLDWLHICHAECCNLIRFKLSKKELKNVKKEGVVILDKKKVSEDQQWYYRLHGAEITKDHVRITLDKFLVDERFLYSVRKCDYLTDDYLCKGHPTNKPKICQDLTLENSSDDKYWVTPSCLFKHKKVKNEGDTNVRL